MCLVFAFDCEAYVVLVTQIYGIPKATKGLYIHQV